MRLEKTIVLKPTLGCNLRCGYCYEFNRNETAHEAHRLRIEEVEALILRTARLFPGARVLWMLHGGEPLLNGQDFFDRFAEAIRKANRDHGVAFSLAVQTNATLLTDEWMAALEANADLMSERVISISIDGPRAYNDLARRTRQGESAFVPTMEAVARVQASSLDFTTISVVGAHTVGHPEEVYRFIQSLRPTFSKYIPCYNFASDGTPEKLGITPLAYATFMCRLFDLWMHDLPRTSAAHAPVIDPIVTILATLTRTPVTWCEYRKEKCDNFTAVYPNGELWLCDTFDHATMREAAFLGNVRELSDEVLVRALTQPCQACAYARFYQEATRACAACPVQSACQGGCIANRMALRERSERLFREHCEAKRQLIRHIEAGLSHALP